MQIPAMINIDGMSMDRIPQFPVRPGYEASLSKTSYCAESPSALKSRVVVRSILINKVTDICIFRVGLPPQG